LDKLDTGYRKTIKLHWVLYWSYDKKLSYRLETGRQQRISLYLSYFLSL